MHLPKFRKLPTILQLSLFAAIILIFGVFVAVNSSQKQQETRSRADYAIPSYTPTPTLIYAATSTPKLTQAVCNGLVVVRALTLDKTSVTFGDTISGKITYSNPCTVPVAVKSVAIGGKTPTKIEANFSNATGALTVLPGQMVTVEGSRAIAVGDAVGLWTAFGTYQDAEGVWHPNGASISFSVVNAITVTPPGPTVFTPTISTTILPTNTYIGITLLLDGIGNAGDRSNPKGKGNPNPNTKERVVSIELFNDQNQLVLTKTVAIKFDSSKGIFTAVSDLGTGVPGGLYTVKIKTDKYLKAIIPGIQTLTAGQINNLPTTTLIAGDINGDNQINIFDYNILMNCYSDLLPAVSCDEQKKRSSDITDDEAVNQYDYNLFLRELNNRVGD